MDRVESKAERRDKPVGSGRTASRFDLVLDTVGRLLRRGAIGNLERMVSKMHPADVAKMLHHLNTAQEKRTVFELIKPDTSKATALSEMDEGDIGDVLQDMPAADIAMRSEEHTSELQSQSNLVCRLLLEKKKKYKHPS